MDTLLLLLILLFAVALLASLVDVVFGMLGAAFVGALLVGLLAFRGTWNDSQERDPANPAHWESTIRESKDRFTLDYASDQARLLWAELRLWWDHQPKPKIERLLDPSSAP